MTEDLLPVTVGILIPAYNEARTIESVVREARSVATTVLVVDDGSSDSSASIAQAAGARVLRRERNGGQGQALAEGILALRKLGIREVITLDADAAHDAASAVNLWAAHTGSGADLTIGSRFLSKGALEEIPSHKIAVNRLGAKLVSLLLHVRLTDVACGMRVMGPRALSLPTKSSGFGFAFELIWCAVRKGLKLHEFPVPVRYDAREPFWTKQVELIEFLRACFAMAETYPAAARLITRLEQGVLQFEQLLIRLGGDLYYLHGLRNYQAYMVQIQHTCFVSKPDDDFILVDFDSAKIVAKSEPAGT
jgi:glycosyltransferase involved in cell wall biosynthesis